MAVRSQERKGNMTKRTQLLSNPPPQTFVNAFSSASRPLEERAAPAFASEMIPADSHPIQP